MLCSLWIAFVALGRLQAHVPIISFKMRKKGDNSSRYAGSRVFTLVAAHHYRARQTSLSVFGRGSSRPFLPRQVRWHVASTEGWS
ncbi:hypothetical protein GE09DRAFT_1109741 [Coniochaeta sp. 2T2.1]|nr:hypothetical protein GE09DRAFT_1109741 [Coniochaeta sp. 2T2.1]